MNWIEWLGCRGVFLQSLGFSLRALLEEFRGFRSKCSVYRILELRAHVLSVSVFRVWGIFSEGYRRGVDEDTVGPTVGDWRSDK